MEYEIKMKISRQSTKPSKKDRHFTKQRVENEQQRQLTEMEKTLMLHQIKLTESTESQTKQRAPCMNNKYFAD